MFGILAGLSGRKRILNSASKSTGEVMQTKVSVALVGAGYWGKKLLPKFVESAESLVKAVCDIHPAHRRRLSPSLQRFQQTSATTFFPNSRRRRARRKLWSA